MSNFWSLWIIGLTVITLVGVSWVLFSNRKITRQGGEDTPTTGHVYDGIEEYDNPLPAWWFKMFVLSIVFGIGYLIAMPGLGNFAGLLGWTSEKEWQQEVQQAEALFADEYQQYLATAPEQLAKDDKAMKMASRVFANNCATCHGSAGRGNFGFPNLQDQDWLYGNSAAQIRQSIAGGRQGAMPAWGQVLTEEQLQAVVTHVQGLSEQRPDNEQGKQIYGTYCAACHGADGGGNPMLGAPRLSDAIWLYGGSRGEIIRSIRSGRNGRMPAHGGQLSELKIHLLTAYILSLGQS